MTSFSLEDALSSVRVPFRRNEFVTDILETQLPGVHFNVDEVDDVGRPKAPMSPPILKAGRPRVVDGAREDHMVPGYQQNLLEGWDFENAAMKMLAEGSEGVHLSVREEEHVGEHFAVSHSHFLGYLIQNGPSLMENLEDKETNCSMFVNVADNVIVLPPADEPLPWDILNMSLWKDSLRELIKEMKTVEEKCPSLIRNSGVYVLTTTPYAAFLRALAAEIADRRG